MEKRRAAMGAEEGIRSQKTGLKGPGLLLSLAMAFALLAHAPQAAGQSSLGISSVVADSCVMRDTAAVSLGTYLGGGDALSAGDLSLDCRLSLPYAIAVEADGAVLFSGILVDDGFGGQFHVERTDGEKYTVEWCDSLGDVPEVGGLDSGITGETPSQPQAGAGNVSVTIAW
jgi:hypothetical protein